MMFRSKHADLMYECITYYIYAYQLRCPKQDVLRTLIKVFYMSATEAGIRAAFGWRLSRVLRTSKLLPKVVICINIIRYTR